VAGGVADALAQGVLGDEEARECVLIAAVWVSPAARDEQLVYTNNRAAVTQALRAGAAGEPQLAEVLANRDAPHNPYFGSR
jgi:5,6,7,8-tetrahydromethanopterin hydro-lyase